MKSGRARSCGVSYLGGGRTTELYGWESWIPEARCCFVYFPSVRVGRARTKFSITTNDDDDETNGVRRRGFENYETTTDDDDDEGSISLMEKKLMVQAVIKYPVYSVFLRKEIYSIFHRV